MLMWYWYLISYIFVGVLFIFYYYPIILTSMMQKTNNTFLYEWVMYKNSRIQHLLTQIMLLIIWPVLCIKIYRATHGIFGKDWSKNDEDE